MIILVIAATVNISTRADAMKDEMKKQNRQVIIRVWYPPEKKEDEGRYEFYSYKKKDDEDTFHQIEKDKLPEEIASKAEKFERYMDTDSDYWQVELTRFEDVEKVKKSIWKDTDIADNIFLTWINWTENTENPEDEDVEFFHEAAEKFYRQDPDGWVWKQKENKETGLVSFIVIKNGEDRLIENDAGTTLYRIEDEPVELFTCPEGGVLDCYWFLD